MARRGESPTLAHEIQLRLRDEILRGLLQPGERLMASEHGARLGVSQSVIREALMRLVQQRLVLLEDNHGFRVASVSPKDLNDLTVARELNESAAIVLSIENGGVGWESEVVAAHHRLSITPMRIDTSSPKRTDDWLAAHREFHNTLYEACDNPILFQICESLADRAELYRRWSLIDPASPNRDLEAEHTDLMRAVVARDANLAVKHLRNHVKKTAQIVLDNWEFHRLQEGSVGVAAQPNHN